jgi:hypothetical protein
MKKQTTLIIMTALAINVMAEQNNASIQTSSTTLSHTFCGQSFDHIYSINPAMWSFGVESTTSSGIPGPAGSTSISAKSKSYVYVGEANMASDISQSPYINVGVLYETTNIGSGTIVTPAIPVKWRSVSVLYVDSPTCTGYGKIRVDGHYDAGSATSTVDSVQYIDTYQ